MRWLLLPKPQLIFLLRHLTCCLQRRIKQMKPTRAKIRTLDHLLSICRKLNTKEKNRKSPWLLLGVMELICKQLSLLLFSRRNEMNKLNQPILSCLLRKKTFQRKKYQKYLIGTKEEKVMCKRNNGAKNRSISRKFQKRRKMIQLVSILLVILRRKRSIPSKRLSPFKRLSTLCLPIKTPNRGQG